MTTTATTIPAGPRGDRYRQAERSLWRHYGLKPRERFVDLSSPPVRLRVVEIGSGPPMLFIPGTAGTGPYPAISARRGSPSRPQHRGSSQ